MRTLPARTPWQRHSRPEAGLVLRPAASGDLAPLAALKRRVETRAYSHLGTPEALAERLRLRCTAWHLLTLIGEGHLVLVAEVDGTPAGLAAAGVDRHSGDGALRLHSAYVEQPGRGVGRALTAARLEAGARQGLSRVVAGALVGAHQAEERLRCLGLVETGPRTPCPTFPGVLLSHWAGSVDTALERVGG